MPSFLKRIGLDTFLFLLLTMILIAWLMPGPGSQDGFFTLSGLAHWGVSVIFFFYGLRLDWQKIREGLSNVRLHMLVLLATFVYFPLLVFGFMAAFGTVPSVEALARLASDGLTTGSNGTLATGLWLGIFFMAALPSTVSSSVVMVNIAKGNVPAAIFDASISSLLGVFLTPLWMSLFIVTGNESADFGQVILSLTCQVILPVGLGIFLHRWWGAFSARHGKLLSRFDQSIILLIVYTSFSHSFAANMFSGLSAHTLLLLGLGLVVLFFIVYGTIDAIARLLRFPVADRICALFCGSKKSLVHGTVMAHVILADPALAGILILPIMLYHALQLVLVSAIAQRYAQRVARSVHTDSQQE
ncbi:MAG: bile acid:sodium symporter family protein [Planctomycetia bacterium]|nr:bile acid:sodium symporter family protein [Planctomycetia bacterium]